MAGQKVYLGVLIVIQIAPKNRFRSEVTNMRPAKEFPVAREHFGETSTFKHFFPV